MKRKKSKRAAKKIGNKELRREIINILRRNPNAKLPAKVISKKLSVKKNTEQKQTWNSLNGYWINTGFDNIFDKQQLLEAEQLTS